MKNYIIPQTEIVAQQCEQMIAISLYNESADDSLVLTQGQNWEEEEE